MVRRKKTPEAEPSPAPAPERKWNAFNGWAKAKGLDVAQVWLLKLLLYGSTGCSTQVKDRAPPSRKFLVLENGTELSVMRGNREGWFELRVTHPERGPEADSPEVWESALTRFFPTGAKPPESRKGRKARLARERQEEEGRVAHYLGLLDNAPMPRLDRPERLPLNFAVFIGLGGRLPGPYFKDEEEYRKRNE